MVFTKKGLHGSPLPHADLRDDGWEFNEKTGADSILRQGWRRCGSSVEMV